MRPIKKLISKLGVTLCAVFVTSPASADLVLDGVAIVQADAVKKFDGMHQHGVQISFGVLSNSDKFWIPRSLDLSAGRIERGGDTADFVSFGPSYRVPLSKHHLDRLFVDFGSLPTYMEKSTFQGKPLGGKFFFTSYLGLGAYLDRKRRTSILIRIQHTSNAGMDGENPGVDMLGMTFSYHFGRDGSVFVSNNDPQK